MPFGSCWPTTTLSCGPGFGCCSPLEEGFEVVAEVGDVDAALRCLLGQKPSVIVLDLNMPGRRSSLEAIPLMLEASSRTAVVGLTM